MADAIVTIKLSPAEHRRLHESLTLRKDAAAEHAREMQGEDPRLAHALREEAIQLGTILGKI